MELFTAEPIRMLLNHASVEFEDERISIPEIMAKKENGELPRDQIPIWTTNDGKVLNQSEAILRMLAFEHGYMPTTSE